MDKTSALEALAEARLSVLYFKRVAVEAKDKASADKLALQGEELKARIAALRRIARAEWSAGARHISARFQTAQRNLQAIVRDIEKKGAAVARVGKAVELLSDLLSITSKWI